MVISDEAHRLKDLIVKAIEDHKITRAEYEEIIHLALDDGHVDKHERILLAELQSMINDKTVRLVP